MKGGRKSDSRTFENDGILWYPDVTKGPRALISFEKYPARLVSKNTDLLMLKVVDWIGFEFAHICLPRCGEIRRFVEVRVFLESKTSVVPKAAEVPKNFLYI
jgi:hypothetical protein